MLHNNFVSTVAMMKILFCVVLLLIVAVCGHTINETAIDRFRNTSGYKRLNESISEMERFKQKVKDIKSPCGPYKKRFVRRQSFRLKKTIYSALLALVESSQCCGLGTCDCTGYCDYANTDYNSISNLYNYLYNLGKYCNYLPRELTNVDYSDIKEFGFQIADIC